MKVQGENYTHQTAAHQAYQQYAKKAEAPEQTSDKAKDAAGVTVEFSSQGMEAAKGQADTVNVTRAAKLAQENAKMSKEDRVNLINQLKADQESRVNQMTNMVQKLLGGQVGAYGKAGDIWSILRKGDFTVDAATKAQAQQDISEDGYYGVKQTSERMYQFALALSDGDVDKMKEMQKAMEKGYKMAEKTWGGKLPEISQKTMEAANKLFDDYYASMGVAN